MGTAVQLRQCPKIAAIRKRFVSTNGSILAVLALP